MSKVAKAVGVVVSFALAIVTAPFGGAPFFIKLGNYLLVSWALDVAATNLISTPGRPKGTPQDVEYTDTTSPGRIIYGKQLVSGMNVIPPWKSGTKSRYLHQVLVVACHEVQDIQTVYFNKDEITSIGSVTGTVNDGKVSAGQYTNAAWIRRYKGTDSQTADFILNNAFTQWTDNHRGRGNAYLALQYDLENAEAYEHGKPEVTCIVLGRKCYDPRLDTSPGANPTTASYIAYTTNPALCTADYLISEDIGLGEDPARIDWDTVVAAANICDESVSIPGSTTQSRYTCNLVLEVALSEEERRHNLLALVGAMMGAVDWRGGKWRIHAGAASDSTFSLGDSDLAGRLSIRTEIPTNLKHNYVRGQFLDRSRNYQASEYEPRSNSTYETDDGDRLPREVNFPACDNQYEAQRNAIIVLKRSRRKLQITGRFKMAAFPIRLWDTGTLTLTEFGLSALKVRCIGWTFNQEGTIDCIFQDEVDSDWDDPSVGSYTVPGVGSGPNPGSSDPEEVASFVVTSAVDGVQFNIEHPVGWIPQLDYFRVYMHTSATPFSSATRMTQTKSDRPFIKLDTTSDRFWWVTHVRRPGNNEVESAETPSGSGVQCAALALTDVFHAAVNPSSHLKILVGTGAGTTTQQSVVTPVKGTSPYTYAWTRTAGSTKISPVASTSATTGFSASGLANGEQVSATFRCRVTDNVAATFDVFVQVTFRRDDSFYL